MPSRFPVGQDIHQLRYAGHSSWDDMNRLLLSDSDYQFRLHNH